MCFQFLNFLDEFGFIFSKTQDFALQGLEVLILSFTMCSVCQSVSHRQGESRRALDFTVELYGLALAVSNTQSHYGLTSQNLCLDLLTCSNEYQSIRESFPGDVWQETRSK